MLETTKLVYIATGEIIEAVIQPGNDPYFTHVWLPQHLNKDGGIPHNRRSDGFLMHPQYPRMDSYTHFSQDREVTAKGLRDRIARLQAEVYNITEELLDLYKEDPDATLGH